MMHVYGAWIKMIVAITFLDDGVLFEDLKLQRVAFKAVT